MKKILITLFVISMLAVSLGFVIADVNSVTPSTNDINIINGWSQVNGVPGVGEVEFEFVNPRGFVACFEYRTDGDTSQASGNNYNPGVTDGLYPYTCVGAPAPGSDTTPKTKTITANEYVEIRMVFGGETDERFDWTRFDVLPVPRSAEITSPTVDEEVSGMVSFDATLTDDETGDGVQWAVRKGTCAAGTNTVFGNVDGFSDTYTWDNNVFNAVADTSSWELGEYCFIFNPKESSGETPNLRETREFVLVEQTKADVLQGNGVPGKGIANAPGLQKLPPNENFA